MGYHPEGTSVKDAWYFTAGDEVHCIHMQRHDPDAEDDVRQFCSLGHAVSTDLIAWRTLPTALRGGEPGSYDDGRLHTGCVIEVDGTCYLYHTATSTAQRGVNRTALATSTDTITWEKHPENPIIVPDPRWYYSEGSMTDLRCHGWPIVDCRDFEVVPDPDGDGYWGFYAARRHGTECAETSVIALCHSTDLVHWEHHPPCFAPDRYACIEVPDVFFLDGRWYLLCLTGNGYGQRRMMSDRNLRQGTIYAVADRVQGPYHEPDDNVLIGSIGRNGFAARTVQRDGVRYLFYTQVESQDGSDICTISVPKVLRTDGSGRLLPCYFGGLDAYRGGRLLESVADPFLDNEGQWGSIGDWRRESGPLTGSCRTDWALHVYERSGDDFICAADVRIQDARSAGLAFRIRGDDVRGGCYAAILDADAGEVILTRPRNFRTLDKRNWPVRRDRTYRLKCAVSGSVINLFIDGVLALQTSDPEFSRGRFGLFVERGAARFSRLTADRLHGKAGLSE